MWRFVAALFLFSLLGKSESFRCFETGLCTDSTSVGSEQVEDLDECIELCRGTEDCLFFSFHTGNQACSLLRDCNNLDDSETPYVSGSEDCGLGLSQCFDQVKCKEKELIDGIEAKDLNECYERCSTEEECSYYEFSAPNELCSFYATCPEFEESDDSITASFFCPLENYNCFFNNRCIGRIAGQLDTQSVEVCYHYCLESEECNWFVQDQVLCTLYSTCEERDECESCVSAKKDCPPGPLPHVLLRMVDNPDVDEGGSGEDEEPGHSDSYHLALSTFDLSVYESQPNNFFVPEELDLTELNVVCWSSVSSIAVLCSSDSCFHYHPISDEWSESFTRLRSIPDDLMESVCTDLLDGRVLITGAGNRAQVLRPSVATPPAQTTMTELTDDRTGHCALMLNDTHMFVGFGSQRGVYVANLAFETSELFLQEIEVTDFGCDLVTDPDTGRDKIMIVGGQYTGGFPIETDFQGLLFIDVEDWSYEAAEELLPVEVHGAQSVTGTDLPLFIAKSRSLHGSSYLLEWDFNAKNWITYEDPHFWPHNEFFAFAMSFDK